MSALEPPSSGTEAHRPTVENLRHALRGLQESAEAQTSSVVHILHDELGGLLVSAMMDLSWITAFRCGPRPGKLARVHHALATAIDLNRNLIESLRPSILDNCGLAAAFRWHLTHACERGAALCTHTLPDHESKLRLKHVDFSLAIDNDRLLLQVAHEHHAAETVDMLHASANLHATIQRIEALAGSWSIHRSETGSVSR